MDVDDGRTVADLEAALEAARSTVLNLEQALSSARRIGAAVGILMAHRKLRYDDAFDLLAQASQVTNRKLRDVADEVLLTGTLGRQA